MSSGISINRLKKSFHGTSVFHDFSMPVESGKITAVLGPNGSGKSTLLHMLCEILCADEGECRLEPSNHFERSYAFQQYRESLFPWRTNYKNVALPLQIQKFSREQIQERIEELQRLFDFSIDWDDYPYALSGGQQQMLAFMRALSVHPKILLIDEPFSALDYENNLRLRAVLQTYYLSFRPTILFVTHQVEEAVHLAEKIIVLSRKPTQVLEVIDNPLPYPRAVACLTTEKAHQLKNRVLARFLEAASV